MGNKVIYGCADFAAGTIEFTGESCTGTAYCGEVDWDNHRVAVTIADCVDSDQNTTYYSRCWNTSTGKFEVLIPAECCTIVWAPVRIEGKNVYFLMDESCNLSEDPISDAGDIDDRYCEKLTYGTSIYFRGRYDEDVYPHIRDLRKIDGLTGATVWHLETNYEDYHAWVVDTRDGSRWTAIDVVEGVVYIYALLSVDIMQVGWRDETILIKIRDDGNDYTVIWEKSYNDGMALFDDSRYYYGHGMNHDMTISSDHIIYYTHYIDLYEGDDAYVITKVSGDTGAILKQYDIATLDSDIGGCSGEGVFDRVRRIEILGDHLIIGCWTSGAYFEVYKVNESTGMAVDRACDPKNSWGLYDWVHLTRIKGDTLIMMGGCSYPCDTSAKGYIIGTIDENLNFTGRVEAPTAAWARGYWPREDREGYIYYMTDSHWVGFKGYKIDSDYTLVCSYISGVSDYTMIVMT